MTRLLLLDSSSGNGLIQVATAKEQELRRANPDLVVLRRDFLIDGNWPLFGRWCVWQWNSAQKRGDIRRLEFFIRMQAYGEMMFAPYVFVWFLGLLLRFRPDRIVDTQPLGTQVFLKALRVYNWVMKKNLLLEKVMVDFPTELASHFLWPLRKVPKRDRDLLRIRTIPPLLKKGETAAEFWMRECGVREDQIILEPSPVREAFEVYRGKPKERQATIPVHIACEEEGELLFPILGEKWGVGVHAIQVREGERLITLSLGSQPAREGTLEYVKRFYEQSRRDCKPTVLVILAGAHRAGEESLFAEVSRLSAGIPKGHFRVIPLPFQSDTTIAALFHRSDLTVTRSGGATAHELLAVSTGEIWIHSETKEVREEGDILKGIPGWERGNALYMKAVRGARVVTPSTF